jgi:hypothetical protein
MNPEPIDLLFRPEAPSSFPELDENNHDPIESGHINEWGKIVASRTEWGEIVASVTTGVNIIHPFDVSVRVDVWGLRVGSDIHYHIQHEIGQEALHEPTDRKSAAPLTLGELYDFLMNAEPLFEGEDNCFEEFLQMDGEGEDDPKIDSVEKFLQFFEVDSDFYPDLDRLVRQRFIERWG